MFIVFYLFVILANWMIMTDMIKKNADDPWSVYWQRRSDTPVEMHENCHNNLIIK